MAVDIGPKIGIDGEAEFRRQLSGISTELKTLGTDMQVVTAKFGDNSTSMKAASESAKILEQQQTKLNEKLEMQERALQAAKDKYGENSIEAQKWQQAVNNTTVELAKNAEALDEANANANKFAKGLQVAGGILAGVGAAAGAAAAAIGAAAVVIGKQAVEAFADYEQLVGGVETLFKENAGQLQEYANNAYKTAGLSANEYMETVTSFSASLISSLGGDTEKATKYADMAISDMSDNANKMGSDMATIQSAYQGFAKQNYTLLDNLKLGYGGTKTEMERLLKDAQAISGIEYDISSYADIVDAIHVIQTEMGITGTTAAEAEKTISGSLSATKAAYQNLITGLASGADMSQLVGNLVTSATNVVNNLMPVISQIAASLPEALKMAFSAISELAPELMTAGMELINNTIDGIMSAMPQITQVAVDLVLTLVQGLLEPSTLSNLITGGLSLVLGLIDGISQALPTLIPVIVDAVVLIVDTLISNVDMIIDTALLLIENLAQGLINALPKLAEKVPQIIAKIVTVLTSNAPKVLEMGVTLLIELAKGIIQAIPELVRQLPQIISAMVTGLISGLGQIAEVGLNLIEGLWNGIRNAKDWLIGKLKEWAGSVVKAIKGFFGIHSPSTVFAGIGKNMAQGVGVGFVGEMKQVSKDINNAMPIPTPTMANVVSGAVNGMAALSAGNQATRQTINLVMPDGRVLASYILEPLADYAKANGTPIINAT